MFRIFKSYGWGTWIRVEEVMAMYFFLPELKGFASHLVLSLSETPGIEKSLAEMGTKTLELQSLCSLLQESKEEAVRTLQQKM